MSSFPKAAFEERMSSCRKGGSERKVGFCRFFLRARDSSGSICLNSIKRRSLTLKNSLFSSAGAVMYHLQKAVGHARVKLRTPAHLYFFDGLVFSHAFSVRPVRYHGIVGVT